VELPPRVGPAVGGDGPLHVVSAVYLGHVPECWRLLLRLRGQLRLEQLCLERHRLASGLGGPSTARPVPSGRVPSFRASCRRLSVPGRDQPGRERPPGRRVRRTSRGAAGASPVGRPIGPSVACTREAPSKRDGGQGWGRLARQRVRPGGCPAQADPSLVDPPAAQPDRTAVLPDRVAQGRSRPVGHDSAEQPRASIRKDAGPATALWAPDGHGFRPEAEGLDDPARSPAGRGARPAHAEALGDPQANGLRCHHIHCLADSTGEGRGQPPPACTPARLVRMDADPLHGPANGTPAGAADRSLDRGPHAAGRSLGAATHRLFGQGAEADDHSPDPPRPLPADLGEVPPHACEVVVESKGDERRRLDRPTRLLVREGGAGSPIDSRGQGHGPLPRRQARFADGQPARAGPEPDRANAGPEPELSAELDAPPAARRPTLRTPRRSGRRGRSAKPATK